MPEDGRALVGRECSRITIDAYAPHLVLHFLSDAAPQRIEIGAPFVLEHDGAGQRFEIEGAPSLLGAAAAVVGRKLLAAGIDDSGALSLKFDGQMAIRVNNVGVEPWWIADEVVGVEHKP